MKKLSDSFLPALEAEEKILTESIERMDKMIEEIRKMLGT